MRKRIKGKGKKVCKRVDRKVTLAPTAAPGPRITNANDRQTFVVIDNLTGVSVAVSNVAYGSQDSLLVAARNGLCDWLQVTEKDADTGTYSSSYANFQAADAAGHTYTPGPVLPPSLADNNFSSPPSARARETPGVDFDMPIAKYQLTSNENNALPWTYVAHIAPNITGLHVTLNRAPSARFRVLTGPAAALGSPPTIDQRRGEGPSLPLRPMHSIRTARPFQAVDRSRCHVGIAGPDKIKGIGCQCLPQRTNEIWAGSRDRVATGGPWRTPRAPIISRCAYQYRLISLISRPRPSEPTPRQAHDTNQRVHLAP